MKHEHVRHLLILFPQDRVVDAHRVHGQQWSYLAVLDEIGRVIRKQQAIAVRNFFQIVIVTVDIVAVAVANLWNKHSSTQRGESTETGEFGDTRLRRVHGGTLLDRHSPFQCWYFSLLVPSPRDWIINFALRS